MGSGVQILVVHGALKKVIGGSEELAIWKHRPNCQIVSPFTLPGLWIGEWAAISLRDHLVSAVIGENAHHMRGELRSAADHVRDTDLVVRIRRQCWIGDRCIGIE